MARPVTKSKQIEILEAQVLHYRNCFKAMGEGVHDGRARADWQIAEAKRESRDAIQVANEKVEANQEHLRRTQGLLNVSERQIKGYRKDAETAKKGEDKLYLDLQAVKKDHASAVAYGDLQVKKLSQAVAYLDDASAMMTNVGVPWQMSPVPIRLAFFMGAADRSGAVKCLQETCDPCEL